MSKNPLVRPLPKDIYSFAFYFSEEEQVAYIAVSTSGSGGFLQDIPMEHALAMKETLDELQRKINDGTDRAGVNQDTKNGE